MQSCDVFLERSFFRKFYMQLDIYQYDSNRFYPPNPDHSDQVKTPKTISDQKIIAEDGEWRSQTTDGKTSITMSIYQISVLDFYTFDKMTNWFILIILLVIVLILSYIAFSKICLKNKIKKLKDDELNSYT